MDAYRVQRRIWQSAGKNSQDSNLYSGFESEMVSSLAMQMIVYFTALFFPFWLTTAVLSFLVKFDRLDKLNRFIIIAIYITMPVVECVRLYFAYEGNLREKVPEIGGSWLLTVLIQMPLLLFLVLVPENLPLPLELSAHPIFLLLLVAHIVEGLRTMRKMSWHQAQRFYLYSTED